jgi:hypothetical protein
VLFLPGNLWEKATFGSLLGNPKSPYRQPTYLAKCLFCNRTTPCCMRDRAHPRIFQGGSSILFSTHQAWDLGGICIVRPIQTKSNWPFAPLYFPKDFRLNIVLYVWLGWYFREGIRNRGSRLLHEQNFSKYLEMPLECKRLNLDHFKYRSGGREILIRRTPNGGLKETHTKKSNWNFLVKKFKILQKFSKIQPQKRNEIFQRKNRCLYSKLAVFILNLSSEVLASHSIWLRKWDGLTLWQ